VRSVKPKSLKFRDTDPLQDCYRYGNEYYSVARLIDAAKDLKPFDLPIAGIALGAEIWSGSTIFELAFHVKRCFEADLSKPIILDWNGEIADGRHRLIKAIIDGKQTIKAVRITWKITPDRVESDA